MKKPNFFIVGTPKGGTTSLYHYLAEHPEVFMSPIKETNYFSHSEIKCQGLFYNEEHILNEAQYLNQFEKVTKEKAIGEASVSYLFYESVPLKIKGFNPDAKIIIALRNPIDRAFSHYLMDARLGWTTSSLEDIVNKKSSHKNAGLYYQQYVELGLYYGQVLRYLEVFGKNNVMVILYDDITRDISQVMFDLYSFLNIDNSFKPNVAERHNTFIKPKNSFIASLYKHKTIRSMTKKIMGQKSMGKIQSAFFSKDDKPVIHPELRIKMQELYRDDLIKTANLLQKDLSKWLQKPDF